MNDLVQQLLDEHRQMDRVLDRLAAEIETFRAGAVPDYQLVQEIVDYCLDYPDVCHHPKEDAIHCVVVRRGPALPNAVADLGAAHQQLSLLVRRLHETVERVMRDETMSRDRFIGIAESFIDGYRAHMRAEETSFFPEALRRLDAADWSSLQARLEERANPLLAGSAIRRFVTLRSGILRER